MFFNDKRGPFLPAFGLAEAGTLKGIPSKESKAEWLSSGFETLDRELFDPETCYDLMGQSGIRKARCQSGWAKCEKEKDVYDFAWLDRVVNRLTEVGITPWMDLTFGNPLYTPSKHPSAVGCPPAS